jgi:hypothetical protein
MPVICISKCLPPWPRRIASSATNQRRCGSLSRLIKTLCDDERLDPDAARVIGKAGIRNDGQADKSWRSPLRNHRHEIYYLPIEYNSLFCFMTSPRSPIHAPALWLPILLPFTTLSPETTNASNGLLKGCPCITFHHAAQNSTKQKFFESRRNSSGRRFCSSQKDELFNEVTSIINASGTESIINLT